MSKNPNELTNADRKLLAELPLPGKENQKRQNPYSGVIKELNPQEVVLVDWILDQYNGGRPRCGVQKWDRARMILLKLNPDAYYDLID